MATNDSESGFDESMRVDQMFRAIGQSKTDMDAVYKPIETFIYSVGLAGNFLALITLWRSRKMTTPSFSYHRALVAADFLYCLNFFAYAAADRFLKVDCRDQVYRYRFGAFFTGILHPVLSSLCTYVLHYVTSVIALDRVLALFFPVGYHGWNRPVVVRSVIITAVLMSATIHTWSSWIEKELAEYQLGDWKSASKHQLRIAGPCWNESTVYYWVLRDELSNVTKDALVYKDIYNGIWRVSYSVLLTLLTLAVISGLIRRRRRREACRSNVGLLKAATSETSMVTTTTTGDMAKKRRTSEESSYAAATATDSSAANNKRRKSTRGCERMLFVLMIAVVLLALFQVTASEAARVFRYAYPPEAVLAKVFSDEWNVTLDEKLRDIRFAMYGQFYMKLISSAFTAVERSFVCILYMAMNAIFRRELLDMLAKCCMFQRARARFCKIRAASAKKRVSTSPRWGADALSTAETGKMVVADVEPTTGCQRRSIVVERDRVRML